MSKRTSIAGAILVLGSGIALAEERLHLTAERVTEAVSKAKTGKTELMDEIERALAHSKDIEVPKGLLPLFTSLLKEPSSRIQRFGIAGMTHFKDRKSQADLVEFIEKTDPQKLEKQWGNDPQREPEYSRIMLNVALAVCLLGEVGDQSVLPVLDSLRGIKDLQLEWKGAVVVPAIDSIRKR